MVLVTERKHLPLVESLIIVTLITVIVVGLVCVCGGQRGAGLGCGAPGILMVRAQVRLLLVTYVLSCLR